MLTRQCQHTVKTLILCLAGLIFTAQAQSNDAPAAALPTGTPLPPNATIELVTNEILGKIEAHRSSVKNSTDDAAKAEQTLCFFADIEETLARVVDFDWIALNVMGAYRKTANTEQKQQFAKAFRAGLVETYSRGLLSYSSEKIVLLSNDTELGDKRKVSVRQEIRGLDNNYPLKYTMGLKNGQWKIINVTINGINLGKTFKNQFMQSAEKHSGNIDKVITGWDSSI